MRVLVILNAHSEYGLLTFILAHLTPACLKLRRCITEGWTITRVKANLIKNTKLQTKTCAFVSCFAGRDFARQRPSASLAVQTAWAASDHHDMNNGGPNQWIRVNIISWLLKIHLSLLEKNSQVSAGDGSHFLIETWHIFTCSCLNILWISNKIHSWLGKSLGYYPVPSRRLWCPKCHCQSAYYWPLFFLGFDWLKTYESSGGLDYVSKTSIPTDGLPIENPTGKPYRAANQASLNPPLGWLTP